MESSLCSSLGDILEPSSVYAFVVPLFSLLLLELVTHLKSNTRNRGINPLPSSSSLHRNHKSRVRPGEGRQRKMSERISWWRVDVMHSGCGQSDIILAKDPPLGMDRKNVTIEELPPNRDAIGERIDIEHAIKVSNHAGSCGNDQPFMEHGSFVTGKTRRLHRYDRRFSYRFSDGLRAWCPWICTNAILR